MTKDKAIYSIATGMVCSVMVFSAINFNLANPVGPMKGAFAHLGFPDYFRIELTVAKALGVLALVIPHVPRKAKEFAYSGFAITLISASIAHFSSGDSILFVVDPLLFLGALVTSYTYFNKLNHLKPNPQGLNPVFGQHGGDLTESVKPPMSRVRGPRPDLEATL
ncbi:MAG TPA: DoxX family protein [Bryobacteraceae bacterium]|nr:DoxX family protein [Bryobacteraceae bacterium]